VDQQALTHQKGSEEFNLEALETEPGELREVLQQHEHQHEAHLEQQDGLVTAVPQLSGAEHGL